MKVFFRWAKLVILVYSIIGIVVYYIQDRLILHPTPLSAYTLSQPFTELDLNYDTATNLNVVELKTADSVPKTLDSVPNTRDSVPKGVVLFFHDGKGNNGDYAGALQGLTAQGYEVWMMDYPGFGKSTGPIDEQRLYAQALVFYKLARSRWKPAQIVLYGQGFGTGIAAQLAAVRNCLRLILERPYYSMTSVFRRYLFLYPVGGRFLHYHLPVYEYLQKVTDPVTIIRGDSRLKDVLKPGDVFTDDPVIRI